LIDSHLDLLANCFPDASTWFFTETGYSNSPQSNAGRTVPEAAAATYAIRGICDFFVRGCIYGRFELLDDPDSINYATQQTINQSADRQAHYGIVAMSEATIGAAKPDTWRKKPEFYATQRFLRLLSDPAPPWVPRLVDVVVRGGGEDLQHLLLQKRDGRHYLLLWRDVPVTTNYPDPRSLDVVASTLTVELLDAARPMALYSPRHSVEPFRQQAPRNAITFDVAGDLVVLEIG
jgi:hypothetical protein